MVSTGSGTRTPLRDLSDNPQKLLEIALANPGRAQGRLAASLLAASGEENLELLRRKSSSLPKAQRDRLYSAVAEEMWLNKPYKKNKELVFVALYGKQGDALDAMEELSKRDAVFELFAVADLARDGDVRDLAMLAIDESARLVDVFMAAVRSYNDSGYEGFFKDFLLEKEGREALAAGDKRCIAFLSSLLQRRAGEAWNEFRSDISLIPLAMVVASVADRHGRHDDAREIFETVLGKKHIARIAGKIENEGKTGIADLITPLSESAWGTSLLTTLNEWANVKDALRRGDNFRLMQKYLNPSTFVVDSEEELIMSLLPAGARRIIDEEVSRHFEELFSPYLTEKERQKATGKNQKMARMTLNLGPVDRPSAKTFTDPDALERSVQKAEEVYEANYPPEKIRAIFANRIVTGVMECTGFQNSVEEAEKFVSVFDRALGGTSGRLGSLGKRALKDAHRILKSYIDYHREITASGQRMDFYKSVRIRAFMDQRRILVADGTGTGKTVVALGAKMALDAEIAAKGLKRRASVLVLAPPTGSLASWGKGRLDDVCDEFNLDKQGIENVLVIRNRRDLKKLAPRKDKKTGKMVQDHYDIVVLGYGALSSAEPESNAYLREIMKHDFDAMYVDECHNVKNAKKNRGRCAKDLILRFKDKRLLQLSATPLPNRIDDGIGMLLFALDPSVHPDPERYVYNNDPEQVRELMLGQRWFRRTLVEARGMSISTQSEVIVELPQAEADAYFRMWTESAFSGMKLDKLQRMLVDQKYAQKLGVEEPAKLRALDRIVEDAMGPRAKVKKKVIIWTPLVGGVTAGLLKRYERYGSVQIIGDQKVSTPQRVKIANTFRRGKLTNVLIISTVCDEAVELSCGDTPVVLVRLVPPMTPRQDLQTAGRVDRWNQNAPVEIVNIVAQSNSLTKRMVEFVNSAFAELERPTPRGFRGQTIDYDVLMLLRWKREITDKVFMGEKLTEVQRELMSKADSKIDRMEEFLASSVAGATRKLPPFLKAIFIDQKLRGRGAEEIAGIMDSGTGKVFAYNYEKGWVGSHSYNTLMLVRDVMKEKGYQLGGGSSRRIADFGGGAAYASRATGHPTTVVDLNQHFLDWGREVSEKLGLANAFIKADMRHTGLESAGFDTVVASYSLHHLRQDGECRQVEEALLEANRVLKNGGEMFITIPYSAGSEALRRLSEGMQLYGFSLLDETGEYHPVFENGKEGRKIMLITAKKEKDCSTLAPYGNWELFQIYDGKTRQGYALDRLKIEQKRGGKDQDDQKKKVIGFRKIR